MVLLPTAVDGPDGPDGPWAAPLAQRPVSATVGLPGSKSQTNRALLLAALSQRPVTLRSALRSRDTALMAAALAALGAGMTENGDTVVVTPFAGGRPRGHASVACGNAGTVARFLPAVAALADGPVSLHGDPRMSQRPLGPLIGALRQAGAVIAGEAIPLTVHGRGEVTGGELQVDATGSSQLVSGLLLSAPRFRHGVDLTHTGAVLPSPGHIEMTLAALVAAGADVEATPRRWRVFPGTLQAPDTVIEPDLSSAAVFLAAALVTSGTVRVPAWPARTTQPGRQLPGQLAAFGARCEAGPTGLTVRGPSRLDGVDLDLTANPEALPVFTALAALASSGSRFRGVAQLRGQETDRLAALADQLGRLGARITVTADGLEVRPAPLSAAPGLVLDPQADHRLAMAYALVGLVVPGVRIHDIATTAKTLPDFPRHWAQLLAASPPVGGGADLTASPGRGARPGPQ